MDMFITDSELPQWEALLHSTDPGTRLSSIATLAWHLRERDSARSIELVAQAKNLLPHTALSDTDRLSLSARLQLTSAEVKWLFSELETAQKLAHAALIDFQAVGDYACCSDVHWLLAAIASDNDSFANPDVELEQAIAHARMGSEQLRMDVPLALSAFRLSHRSPLVARERWGKLFPPETKTLHPGLATWVNSFWASFFMQTGDFGKAAVCCIQAFEHAITS